MDGIVGRQVLKLVEEDFNSEEILLPDPPEFMSYEAKCEFLRSIEDVIERGIYSGPNIGIFESYCIATGFARECEQKLAEDGMIIPPGKPHPAYKMMLDAMSSARAGWEILRPKKLIIKEDEEENEWKNDKGLLA